MKWRRLHCASYFSRGLVHTPFILHNYFLYTMTSPDLCMCPRLFVCVISFCVSLSLCVSYLCTCHHFVYISSSLCMYPRLFVHVLISLYVCSSLCMCPHLFVCVFISLHMCSSLCMCPHLFICVLVSLYVSPSFTFAYIHAEVCWMCITFFLCLSSLFTWVCLFVSIYNAKATVSHVWIAVNVRVMYRCCTHWVPGSMPTHCRPLRVARPKCWTQVP